MKHGFAGMAFAALVLTGAMLPAQARPPTVANSPGYDARLAESRKALQMQPVEKSNLSAADKKWIDTCVTQRKASNARPAALRKYCGCMHDVVENNQPFEITELERTYPRVHEQCWARYRMR